jgi:hypothetical protein
LARFSSPSRLIYIAAAHVLSPGLAQSRSAGLLPSEYTTPPAGVRGRRRRDEREADGGAE